MNMIEELRKVAATMPNDARRLALTSVINAFPPEIRSKSFSVVRPDGSQTTMTEMELRAMAKGGWATAKRFVAILEETLEAMDSGSAEAAIDGFKKGLERFVTLYESCEMILKDPTLIIRDRFPFDEYAAPE